MRDGIVHGHVQKLPARKSARQDNAPHGGPGARFAQFGENITSLSFNLGNWPELLSLMLLLTLGGGHNTQWQRTIERNPW